MREYRFYRKCGACHVAYLEVAMLNREDLYDKFIEWYQKTKENKNLVTNHITELYARELQDDGNKKVIYFIRDSKNVFNG